VHNIPCHAVWASIQSRKSSTTRTTVCLRRHRSSHPSCFRLIRRSTYVRISTTPISMPAMQNQNDVGARCSRPRGIEHQSFECRACDHAEKVVVALDPMNPNSLGWLAGELGAPSITSCHSTCDIDP
jgi:hypothetical protein